MRIWECERGNGMFERIVSGVKEHGFEPHELKWRGFEKGSDLFVERTGRKAARLRAQIEETFSGAGGEPDHEAHEKSLKLVFRRLSSGKSPVDARTKAALEDILAKAKAEANKKGLRLTHYLYEPVRRPGVKPARAESVRAEDFGRNSRFQNAGARH